MSESDRVFAGSIPALYDRYLGPLIFAEYAADLAKRAAALQPARVLEIAAGTGIVTRAMVRAVPAGVEIIALDRCRQGIRRQPSACRVVRMNWRRVRSFRPFRRPAALCPASADRSTRAAV